MYHWYESEALAGTLPTFAVAVPPTGKTDEDWLLTVPDIDPVVPSEDRLFPIEAYENDISHSLAIPLAAESRAARWSDAFNLPIFQFHESVFPDSIPRGLFDVDENLQPSAASYDTAYEPLPSPTAYPTEPLLPDSFSLPIAFDTETPVISTFPLPELDIDQPDGAITVPSALTAQRRLVGIENVIFCSTFSGSGTAPYAAAGATREAAATAIEATARKALPAPFRQQTRDKFSITILIDSITSATTESR